MENGLKRERTDGIWIKASNIKVIEFINRQGESLMDKKYGQFGYQPVRIEKKGYQPTTSGHRIRQHHLQVELQCKINDKY